MLRSLRHRNIVQFYGACLQPDCFFIVTELMHGAPHWTCPTSFNLVLCSWLFHCRSLQEWTLLLSNPWAWGLETRVTRIQGCEVRRAAGI